MPTPAEYSASVRSALKLTDPEMATTVGTPLRKIIDAFSEVMAEASVDQYLMEYTYDLDTKSGKDLEDFCRTMGGFGRIAPKRASGSMTFERMAPSAESVVIPYGTQVATSSSPLVTFFTVTPAVLQPADLSIEVAVQAVQPGAAGNVQANTVDRPMQPIAGITSMLNLGPMTGGMDAESDAQLRARFRKTFLRNLAGTEDMFLAIALENLAVSQANVIGAAKVRREQIEIVGGTATSTVEDASSVYEGTSVLGANIDAGNVLAPDVQYTFDHTSVPPSVAIIDTDNAPDGIYDLVFDYVPLASRNEPLDGITNRVDIYVNGSNAVAATEVRVFSAASSFTGATSDPLYFGSFQRADGSTPVIGNHFIPLALSPVIDPSVDDTIEVDGVDYVEGVDYFLVNDVSDRGGAPQSLAGIEWISVANSAPTGVPADGEVFEVSYLYNSVPREIEQAIRDWRLVSFDTWVHQAKVLYLKLHLAVIFELGFDEASVQSEMTANLNAYFDSVGFNGIVQVSDLYQVIHNVTGIDAVRFLSSTDDATHYAIEQVSGDGDPIGVFSTGGRAIDVPTSDDTVVELHSVRIEVKAANTFGTV